MTPKNTLKALIFFPIVCFSLTARAIPIGDFTTTEIFLAATAFLFSTLSIGSVYQISKTPNHLVSLPKIALLLLLPCYLLLSLFFSKATSNALIFYTELSVNIVVGIISYHVVTYLKLSAFAKIIILSGMVGPC